jgi:hypothetical protein
MILVQMYDKDSSSIGMVKVYFEPQMGYDIAFCTSVWFTELPVQPPGEVEKIWTIAKTETAIIITCNGVEVLNYLFADSSMSDCVPRWDGDVVDMIIFIEHGRAPDFYRAGKVQT